MHESISIENISRNCDNKQQNVKRVTDASFLVKFISRNSDTLEIEHSLFHSPINIPRYGFQFRSTDLADKTHS